MLSSLFSVLIAVMIRGKQVCITSVLYKGLIESPSIIRTSLPFFLLKRHQFHSSSSLSGWSSLGGSWNWMLASTSLMATMRRFTSGYSSRPAWATSWSSSGLWAPYGHAHGQTQLKILASLLCHHLMTIGRNAIQTQEKYKQFVCLTKSPQPCWHREKHFGAKMLLLSVRLESYSQNTDYIGRVTLLAWDQNPTELDNCIK